MAKKSPTLERFLPVLRNSLSHIMDGFEYSQRLALRCDPAKDVTIQSAKDEADINLIVKRFGVTGQLPQVAAPPTYMEYAEVFDFQSAMNVVVAAQRSFEGLDAKVRKRFSNDPAEFVKFCEDPANLPEMRKMGLAIPEVVVDNVSRGTASTVVPPVTPAVPEVPPKG